MPKPQTVAPLGKSAKGPASRRSASELASGVPNATAAVLALMNMGFGDYAEIALAVGLSVAEVEQIDMSEEEAIRRLGVSGIPFGEYFKLKCEIRCPRCHSSIRVVPCVACASRSFYGRDV